MSKFPLSSSCNQPIRNKNLIDVRKPSGEPEDVKEMIQEEVKNENADKKQNTQI